MQGQLLLQLNEFEEAYQVAAETADILPRLDFTSEQLGSNLKTAIHALLGRLNARTKTATLKSKKQWSQNAVDMSTQLVTAFAGCAKNDQSDSFSILARALLAKGKALKEKGFAAAVQAAEKSVALASEVQDPLLLANAYMLQAEAHFADEDINA